MDDMSNFNINSISGGNNQFGKDNLQVIDNKIIEKDDITRQKGKTRKLGKISIVIALLTLIVTIIIGWKEILDFFHIR